MTNQQYASVTQDSIDKYCLPDKLAISMVKPWCLADMDMPDKVCYTSTQSGSTGIMTKAEFDCFYEPSNGSTWHGNTVYHHKFMDDLSKFNDLDAVLTQLQLYCLDNEIEVNIFSAYNAFEEQRKRSLKTDSWSVKQLYDLLESKEYYELKHGKIHDSRFSQQCIEELLQNKLKGDKK